MKWKLNYTGSALALSSGQVWLNSKHSKGLYLKDILEMIESKPNKSYYYREVEKRVTLGEALSSGRFEELGKIKKRYSSIDLNVVESDREFRKLPKTGKQLLSNKYQSKARKVSNGNRTQVNRPKRQES